MARVVLVTGGSGFVGGHLLRALAAEPDTHVVGWTRDPVRSAARVTWAVFDMADREAVHRQLAACRPDCVYHLAGAAHVAQSFGSVTATLRANALATAHLLDALADTRPDARVLVTGSAAVYRPSDVALDETSPIGPTSPYGLSKLAQEGLALRAHADEGLQTIVVRAFNHVGPGQSPEFFASSFARQLAEIEAGRREPVVRVGNLAARRDLTDVRDVVRAYVALMARGVPGVVYNVCSGRAYAIGEVLDMLVAATRVPVRIETDPSLLRPNDTPLALGSALRLQEATGWMPSVPIAETLADLLQDWRDRVAAAPPAPASDRP